MDFPTWYRERHGYGPFPWQEVLATRIAAGDWPEALTAPTGAGKTGVIAVWLWALEAGISVPRRLCYVVDRRLIVDSTVAYAQQLAGRSACTPAVVQMRGGITIDDAWIDPLRPAIVASTVDQAGSRLLFSGYGVSNRVAPVHAALLGNDVLWVLDEVHIAQPLMRTLRQVQTLRNDALPLPLRVLAMSATWDGANALGLTAADWSHPVLAPRLARPKPLEVRDIDPDGEMAPALAREARRLRDQGADVIGVVANTVRDARAVWALLNTDGEAVVLTGRVRPADRDALVAEYLPRMAAGSRIGRAPLYVVATQTIEVGADLDFDALVTESAPLSALRQRAGRLNRLGELPTAPIVMVHRPLDDREKKRHAWEKTRGTRSQRSLYREAAEEARKWIKKHKVRDFGIQAMERHPPLPEPVTRSPDLLAAHLDLLSCTSIKHGIDPSPWLHGYVDPDPVLFLCWRRDAGAQTVELAPPVRQEILELPIWEFRWLEVDQVLRWDGSAADWIDPSAVRPGDTLVLDCTVGGCDRFGWNPQCTDPVADYGDTAERLRLAGSDDVDWRALALGAGMPAPGRVLVYPGGALVLAATESTSEAAVRPVLLRDHLRAVGARARLMADAAVLPEALCDAIERAGSGHDLGKLDARWQAKLAADPDAPLAKGPRGDDPWLLLPRDWRHEMVSATQASRDLLVRHLVGAHHGHGRPTFPVAPDPVLWRQLGGWAAQFEGLQQQYGWWGLAYLEALVRLADWQISKEEQQ
ncbi:type I-U CRISPR-associated helicase/endonuclease Cas3 [uncultured Thiodictyon sp.]|uniref:type I-G CRISPR-associated helicase/endonuclease Cas3g n=1 Tax=uncultured Thiodictyon sp. TaxID=1846217 RepID=UPI0026007C2A|nr:type I-U CRISPR-associated helicase/endonuclease Cas3 [uncultured Thiodictyon sp.]